jgi:FemAB-related protein (PEP-CTERM system-associated)
MSVVIHQLAERSSSAWDNFVEAHPNGTFFHRAAWCDVLTRAFRHTPMYAYAERDGAITGILPLMHVKTALFGNTLISSPFCVYGGPLSTDAETEAALNGYAASALARTKASAVEYRLRERPACEPNAEGWRGRDDLYVTFRKLIENDEAANLKGIPRKQRAMVRKGIERGLVSKSNADVRTLHGIYAESVRNLGTPVFSRRYFELLAEVFRDKMDVVTILDGDRAVASVLNFYDRGEVLPYYGGGMADARSVAGNDFMYWEVMRRAALRGCTLFDFGRSKVGTGAFSFKKNWGFAPQPLFHRFKLAPGADIPDHNPLNPKYRLFIAAWKRLPLAVANRIGPVIVRGVG